MGSCCFRAQFTDKELDNSSAVNKKETMGSEELVKAKLSIMTILPDQLVRNEQTTYSSRPDRDSKQNLEEEIDSIKPRSDNLSNDSKIDDNLEHDYEVSFTEIAAKTFYVLNNIRDQPQNYIGHLKLLIDKIKQSTIDKTCFLELEDGYKYTFTTPLKEIKEFYTRFSRKTSIKDNKSTVPILWSEELYKVCSECLNNNDENYCELDERLKQFDDSENASESLKIFNNGLMDAETKVLVTLLDNPLQRENLLLKPFTFGAVCYVFVNTDFKVRTLILLKNMDIAKSKCINSPQKAPKKSLKDKQLSPSNTHQRDKSVKFKN